ncbi:MAG: AgmX/PglI C-terminal domain-containing protein [Pseudomonadota bacterium]
MWNTLPEERIATLPDRSGPQQNLAGSVCRSSQETGQGPLEDEDLDDLPAPFSLIQHLLRDDPARWRGAGQAPVLEVIRCQGDRVQDVTVLSQGRVFRILRREGDLSDAAGRLRRPGLARLGRDARVHLARLPGLSGHLRSSPDGAERRLEGEPGSTSSLGPGDLADLLVDGQRYLLRVVYPVPLSAAPSEGATQRRQRRVERRIHAASLASSAGLHGLGLVTLLVASALAPPRMSVELDPDRWTHIVDKDLVLAPPPVPDPGLEVPELPAAPRQLTTTRRQDSATRVRSRPGVLQVLGKIAARPGAAGSQTLRVAMSNLSGVKVPGGNAGFKVTGLIARGPTNRIQIGGSGGGVETTGLRSILRRGRGQPGELISLQQGRVRGRLVKTSRGIRSGGDAVLSAGEIQRVVNAGIGQIQSCYERELLKQQALSGKTEFEWTINSTGHVQQVRLLRSTLRSTAAELCMMSRIRSWTFPRPRGRGVVIVTYPFVFSALGF